MMTGYNNILIPSTFKNTGEKATWFGGKVGKSNAVSLDKPTSFCDQTASLVSGTRWPYPHTCKAGGSHRARCQITSLAEATQGQSLNRNLTCFLAAACRGGRGSVKPTPSSRAYSINEQSIWLPVSFRVVSRTLLATAVL